MGDYSNYDLRDDGPYLQTDSTCLINLLGITDTTSLNQAESAITQATLADLYYTPVNGNFDLLHLQEIHRRIFGEIYPFAGKLRQVDIMKGDKLFLPCVLVVVVKYFQTHFQPIFSANAGGNPSLC